MKEIMIWSDFACPFCYIGEKRLKDALEDLGVSKQFRIIYKAFELNRDAPKETKETIPELIAKKYGMSLEDAKKRVADIDKVGNDAGLVFRYASALSSNTLDAHRLMKLAENKFDDKVVAALNEGLFEAYFTDNRRLSDHEVLMQAAVNAGMPTEEVSRVLNSNDFIQQVRHDEDEAQRIGVQGVPFIVFDGRIAVPGAVSEEDFKTVIQEVLKDEPAKDIGKGATCDENGCRLN